MAQYAFYILAAASIFTALLMVTARNPVHSVLYLILTFFSIAGQYVLLNAQFLAVVHIIVYAGAIMVLFLFVLMLLNLNQDTEPQKSTLWQVAGSVAAGLLLVTMTGALRGATLANSSMIPGWQATLNPSIHDPNLGLVKNLGKLLFTDYVVPFEISGILFLAAMVGAVMVGKKDLER